MLHLLGLVEPFPNNLEISYKQAMITETDIEKAIELGNKRDWRINWPLQLSEQHQLQTRGISRANLLFQRVCIGIQVTKKDKSHIKQNKKDWCRDWLWLTVVSHFCDWSEMRGRERTTRYWIVMIWGRLWFLLELSSIQTYEWDSNSTLA